MTIKKGLIAFVALLGGLAAARAGVVSFALEGEGMRIEQSVLGADNYLFLSLEKDAAIVVSGDEGDLTNAKLSNSKGEDVSSAFDAGDGATGRISGIKSGEWYKLSYGDKSAHIRYMEYVPVAEIYFAADTVDGGKLRLNLSPIMSYEDTRGAVHSIKREVSLMYADYVDKDGGEVGDSVRTDGVVADSFIVIERPLSETNFRIVERIGEREFSAMSNGVYHLDEAEFEPTKESGRTEKIKNPFQGDSCLLLVSADKSPRVELKLADKRFVKSMEVRLFETGEKIDTTMSEEGWPVVTAMEKGKNYEVSYGSESCSYGGGRCRMYFQVVEATAMDSIRLDTAVGAMKDTSMCSWLTYEILPGLNYVRRNGDTTVLKREMDVKYETMKFEGNGWSVFTKDTTLSNYETKFNVPSSYSRTTYEFSYNIGDTTYTIVSDTLDAVAVGVMPKMILQEKIEHNREEERNSDEIEFTGEKQGTYSAPLLMDLYSRATSKDLTFEWHFANNDRFVGDRITYLENLLSYSYSKGGDTYIMMKAISPKTGCSASEYIGFTLLGSQLGIPNVFTPNGDGQNDEFRVSYSSIEKFYIRIYSSFGKKVYESDDITKGWDGTYKGNKLANGAYYYVIEAEGTDGEEYKEKGTVNLFREAE